jgi:hypothetical protein
MTVSDLACVIHAHSRYSDGTGSVAQIAAAGARAGADAVLLTDHDTIEAKRRGEERWWGSTLICVGVEVSPAGGNHYLAFGLDEEIDHQGMSSAEIIAAVDDAGGFGFLAHPFSRGSERFRRAGMPWDSLDDRRYTGLELWSFVTDTAEAAASLRDVARFIVSPRRAVVGPPSHNVEAWQRLCAQRPVVAIGGVDAHQIGIRVGGRVPLRLMAYHRSFRHLRTHVLLDRSISGDAAGDRDAIYGALRAGCCYLAVDSLAPARGFSFVAEGVARIGEEAQFRDGQLLRARVARDAALTLFCDGEPVLARQGGELEHRAERPGVYRLEARLPAAGRERTWIVSNPIYLR